ncbi:MAG: hypothetical protein ACI9W2_005106 [Gammaproteobacteria bacterium]
MHVPSNDDARDTARALATTEAYAQSRKDRKKLEVLFAHSKKLMRFDRLRLRGPRGAQEEFLLAASPREATDKTLNGHTATRFEYSLKPKPD